jgi:hypothetical protein
MSSFDPLEVQLLAGPLQRLTGQLGEACDDIVDGGERFVDESDDPEVGGPGGEIGIMDRRHQKRGEPRNPVAEPPDRLEAINPG